jgi:hypothetical protein
MSTPIGRATSPLRPTTPSVSRVTRIEPDRLASPARAGHVVPRRRDRAVLS